MPDFVGHIVERRVPVDFRFRRLEHHALSDGSDAVIALDGTTQIESPSPRRV